jgi:hypothetical protein
LAIRTSILPVAALLMIAEQYSNNNPVKLILGDSLGIGSAAHCLRNSGHSIGTIAQAIGRQQFS